MPSSPSGLISSSLSMRAALEFYVASGVDFALEETPCDRFWDSTRQKANRKAEKIAPSHTRQPAPPARQKPAPMGDVPEDAGYDVEAAHALPSAHPERLAFVRRAVSATTGLEALHCLQKTLPFCDLATLAAHCFTGIGSVKAQLMVVRLTPCDGEEASGVMLSGDEPELLRKMLAAISIDIYACYTSFLIPWRPPGRREPSAQEAELCLPFLCREIALVAPRYVLCLGERVSQELSEEGGAKSAFHTRQGKVFALRQDVLPLDAGQDTVRPQGFALYTPERLMRQPVLKREAWAGLQALKGLLERV